MASHAAQPARSEGTAAQESGNEGGMGLLIFVFVLAIFLGFEMISKVPSQLHTPLMSGSNAISGITVVGALIAAGTGRETVMVVLGTLAVALAMINVVGGYLVTDRMLSMFKRKDRGKP
jgi:NAD(P) transhydrogenase subunit alpha